LAGGVGQSDRGYDGGRGARGDSGPVVDGVTRRRLRDEGDIPIAFAVGIHVNDSFTGVEEIVAQDHEGLTHGHDKVRSAWLTIENEGHRNRTFHAEGLAVCAKDPTDHGETIAIDDTVLGNELEKSSGDQGRGSASVQEGTSGGYCATNLVNHVFLLARPGITKEAYILEVQRVDVHVDVLGREGQVQLSGEGSNSGAGSNGASIGGIRVSDFSNSGIGGGGALVIGRSRRRGPCHRGYGGGGG
jgi:hypothetical protein